MKMIEIDLGLNLNFEPLNSCLIWELMIALHTTNELEFASQSIEKYIEKKEGISYNIDFNKGKNCDLIISNFYNGNIKISYYEFDNEETIYIDYSDFNIENILNAISKFTKITFDLDKIDKEITRQNDLHFD